MRRYHIWAAGAAALMLAGQTQILSFASQSEETETSSGMSEDTQTQADVRTEGETQTQADARIEEETQALIVREGSDDEGNAWVEREVALKSNTDTDSKTVVLRFYEDMPNVAYIGYGAFHELVQPQNPVEITQQSEGVYRMVDAGGEAQADTNKETLSYEDYYAFTDTQGSSATAKTGELLDGSPFARYAGAQTEPGSGAVTFEFADYKIDLRADEEGPYIPFTTLSNLYDDTSFLYHAVFNMQEIVFSNDTYNIGSDCVDPQWSDPILQMKERPADLAAYAYSQLCFALEHFYGYPGQELIDETIMKEQGLDAALKAYGEIGENAARLLQSTNKAEYFAGSERLRLLLWDGDHTNIDFMLNTNAGISDVGPELMEEVSRIDQELNDGFQDLATELLTKPKSVQSCLNFARDEQRKKSLGEGTYFSKGNTAWCVFDQFAMNEPAWDAYYADENRNLDAFLENTQDDSLVILLSALKKAQADPQITNFVVDMTQNVGGNDGTAAAVESLLTGEAKSQVYDALTGQTFTLATEVDRNFDGVFDEKDDEVHYDFHFAILIGEGGYSNGTICPAVLKDSGILTLGEKTRGGCCCLQFLSTAEGIEFLISSSRRHNVNRAGEEIDTGVEPDIDLYRYDEDGKRIETEREVSIGTEPFTIPVPDYSSFYDIEAVGKLIDEYYEQ